MHYKKLAVILLSVLFVGNVVPVVQCAENYAGDFLELGAGARALGMGSAFIAVTDGATSPYYNPAGLLKLKTREANLMHSEQFGGLENYNTISGASLLSDRDAIGFTLIHMGVGNIKYTRLFDPSKALSDSNRPEIASRENATDLALLLSGARKITPRLGIGATVKILRRAIGDDTAFGYGIDLGAQYHLAKSLNMGVVFRDVTGTKVSWDGQLSNDRISATMDAGAAYFGVVPWIGGMYTLAASISYFGDSPRVKGINTMNLGLEYWLRDILAFRAGSAEGNGTFGLGLSRLPLISSSSLDYAFLSHSELDSTHRVSMTIRY
ncbi:MAG: hypothetical protein WCU00_12295 [Candidatus Latescibacterota bacterium]